jgi:hypothetical protein
MDKVISKLRLLLAEQRNEPSFGKIPCHDGIRNCRDTRPAADRLQEHGQCLKLSDTHAVEVEPLFFRPEALFGAPFLQEPVLIS